MHMLSGANDDRQYDTLGRSGPLWVALGLLRLLGRSRVPHGKLWTTLANGLCLLILIHVATVVAIPTIRLAGIACEEARGALIATRLLPFLLEVALCTFSAL
jgi:hypothetical protein